MSSILDLPRWVVNMIRQRSHLRFLTVFLAAALFLGILPSQARAHDEIRVLWIGNSLTYVNDLPKLVAELAEAGGQRALVQDRETPGGCTLEKHWKDGKALAKIQARPWDFVVLQEQSARPITARQAMFEYARKFDAEIKKHGSKTLLYLTWANGNTPEKQEPLSKAYLDLAGELKAAVAPVGVAWQHALAADKRRALHQADNVHPTPAGTYLAACVFYATLFAKSPEGLPGKSASLSDDDARKLQTIAWQTVKDAPKDTGGPFGSIQDVKLAKPEDKEDVKSTPAPEGAVILFGGKDLDGWVKTDRKTKAHWKVLDGGILQVEKGGNIITEKMFDGHFKLHVEFRVPYLPEMKGQQRGNSGVYVQGRYEVQVLDSYGLQSKSDDCGAIYTIAAPLVNACKAPTVWQSYDIEFQAPQCKDGKKTEPGTMTVFHNGVKIHDHVKLTKDNTTAGLGGDPCLPGPIMLQDHGSAVQFRNIWLQQLK